MTDTNPQPGTAAFAHKRVVECAQYLSRAKAHEPDYEEFLEFWQEKYDYWYHQYTNPFNVDKYASAITPTN